ncbi:MAG: hypothetical protein WBB98_04660 [Xanthobacteraceae bacterium]
MDAVATHAFKGVKDGDIYHTSFVPGDVVHGELARLAVEAGNAEYPKRPVAAYVTEPKAPVGAAVVTEPETEFVKKRGRPRKTDNDD